MPNEQPIYPDGLLVKPPRENAPKWVKGQVSIKRKELIAWLMGHTEEWLNFDIKLSKKGGWYAQLNTWKKDQGKEQGENLPVIQQEDVASAPF